jgi:hypothetical protein
MSEKLYALLLRLYPARFRERYGEEAMRVFHERLRDERRAGARLRFWLSLLLDAGSSLPREYRRSATALNAAPAISPAAVPLFRTLESELPKPGSFLGGTIMAFLAVAGLGFLLNHAGTMRHFAEYYAAPQARASAPPSSGSLPTGQGPGGTGSPSSSRGQGLTGQTSAQHALTGQRSAAQSPLDAQRVPGIRLDDSARRRILDAVDATLRQSYPDRPMAERIAASLSASEDRGAYEALSDPPAFADAITRQMRAISGNSDLVLYFIVTPLPKTAPAGDIYWIDQHFLLRVPLAQPAPGHAAPQV